MKRLFVSKYQERAKELYEFHLTHNISPTTWLSARQIEKYKGGAGFIARVKRGGGLFSELKPIYFEYVDLKPDQHHVTLQSNGLANLMIGYLMNMSLLMKRLMSYVQTKTDKEDAALLRKLLTDDLPEQEQIKIIRHVFSDLIKWTYDDLVVHLTQVFDFTNEECSQLIHQYPILSASTTEVITMNAPNYNATAPKDVSDLVTNFWNARKLLQDAARLISATALTPKDFPTQQDFDESVLQRLEIQKSFLSINRFIDDQI